MRLRTVAFWLTVLLIFIIPWENGATIEGLGPIARSIGIIITAFWLGVVLVTGRFRQLHPFHIVTILFLLWNVLTLYWSINTRQTLNRLETYVQLIVMVFLIWDLYTTQSKIRIGMQAYVLGAYVTVWSVISNYLTGTTTGSSGRYTGFGFNENDVALILVIGMGLAWYLAISTNVDKESRWTWAGLLRLVNYAYVPLAVFSVILTASRTAALGLIPFFWFMLGSFTQLKLRSRLLLMVGMVAALLFLQPLVPQASIDRLSTTNSELATGDLNGRRAIWELGIEAFLERPIGGMGSGTFKAITGRQVAHNTYLSVLAETGIIGFLLFVVMIFTAVYQAKYQNKLLVGLWLTVFISWAIGVSSLTWELRKPTWLIMAFVVVSGHILTQQGTVQISDKSEFTPEFSPLASVSVYKNIQSQK